MSEKIENFDRYYISRGEIKQDDWNGKIYELIEYQHEFVEQWIGQRIWDAKVKDQLIAFGKRIQTLESQMQQYVIPALSERAEPDREIEYTLWYCAKCNQMTNHKTIKHLLLSMPLKRQDYDGDSDYSFGSVTGYNAAISDIIKWRDTELEKLESGGSLGK